VGISVRWSRAYADLQRYSWGTVVANVALNGIGGHDGLLWGHDVAMLDDPHGEFCCCCTIHCYYRS